MKIHTSVLCVSCHQCSWFADGTLPGYEDNIKFCWSVLWAGSIWCLYWKQKSKRPLWKVNVVSQCCLQEAKTLLFTNAKYFLCSPKRQVSDIANFSGKAALGFMWKIFACINDEHIRLLLLNNEGACSQSHVPERNQMLIRNSFSMPELPRTQNVGWEKRCLNGLGKSNN